MIATGTVWTSMRPRFLLLTPVCVLLGCAVVIASGQSISSPLLALILLGALSAHIGVNTLNEYQDFTSGLDLVTRKTPFSGGSGALPADPQSAQQVLIVAITSLLLTTVVGAVVVYLRGPAILLPGLIGLLVIVTYTRWLNRVAMLCLIAPGMGFGPLMVIGTSIALGAGWSPVALWLSLPAFFLVNNLLLANQLPDIDADRSVGRNHLAIRYGARSAAQVYVLFLVLAYASIVVPVVLGVLPLLSLAALSTVALGVPAARGIYQYADSPEKLDRFLGLNVALTLLTITVLAVAVIIGA